MKIRVVTWSSFAKQDVRSIKAFFDKRNRSTAYSKKLIRLFKEGEIAIQNHPYATMETDMGGVRAYLILDYILFFSIEKDEVQILRVWDTRRNPSQLRIFLKGKS